MLDNAYLLLIVNPGSTTTKVSIFKDEQEIFTETIAHKIEELSRFNRASDQDLYRMEIIVRILREKEIPIEKIDAVVGRGGLLRPIEGGTYTVNEQMVADLKRGVLGDHPSNCGGLIAYAISKALGCQAFIVDPVVVDEMEPVAKISGMPLIQRRSIFHALNQKAVARDTAKKLGKSYREVNLIVAHLGGGITVGAHRKGRVIDVNNGLDGDGPFSPERSGGVPVGDLVKAAFSGEYTYPEMKKLIKGLGGVVAYLGIHDMRLVEKKIEEGDTRAKLIYEAMAYQVAKEIGALAAVLKGQVDAISLTGGLAHSEQFVEMVKERVSFLAPVFVFPGEQEMRALALGGLRVLKGAEEAKEYRFDE
ncbi:MAG TPA: butyrate kinase [Caldithrix abyssi]|uniref:Probable butyrate kinase n=1 Tax=Caldithrix abyssi TaxID=187145 RepID=A0A7V5PQX5_CALAY|nr:butyrate kinase [Caldithrix abyssi]